MDVSPLSSTGTAISPEILKLVTLLSLSTVIDIFASLISIPASSIIANISSSLTVEISYSSPYIPMRTIRNDLSAFLLSTVTFAVREPSEPLCREADFIISSSKKTRLCISSMLSDVKSEKTLMSTAVFLLSVSPMTSEAKYMVPSE